MCEKNPDTDPTLQEQLSYKNDELRKSLKKLQEAEAKIKEYEEATLDAYEKVDMMEEKLHNEQRCLEKAVLVASRLYTKNSQLKKSTVRGKRIALSERRKAWKQAHSSNSDSTDSVFPATPEGNTTEEACKNVEDSDNMPEAKNIAVMKEEVANEVSDDDLEEITKLDQMAKSDLNIALEKINKLETENHEMADRIIILEDALTERQTDNDRLKAVVHEKTEELTKLKEKYNVESEVRQRAESYAAKMYGKNKAFQRNSVLMKSRRSGDFDKKVESTMKDVEKLTQELEEEKVKRRQEVLKLETQLAEALEGEQMKNLKAELELLQVEVSRLKDANTGLELKNENLRSEVSSLQSRPAPPTLMIPPPPPVPAPPAPAPPPPPPPPPVSSSTINSRNISELVAQRKTERASATSSPATTRKPSTAVDNYASAMEEMMQRIKRGVPIIRRREVASVGSKASSNSSDSDSADEQEYKKFYDSVGKPRHIGDKEEEEKYMKKHPNLGTAKKAATIGYLPRRNDEISWRQNLKPVKQQNRLSGDVLSKGDDDTKPSIRRDRKLNESVRHPDNISQDLKSKLERRRKNMKSAENQKENGGR